MTTGAETLVAPARSTARAAQLTPLGDSNLATVPKRVY
jgi:hypothetical protein